MLKKIEIRGLFDKFDYDIELKEGGLTILTGPNGYGKTTILRMINAVANGNLLFFFELSFIKILFIQDELESIGLTREGNTLFFQLGNQGSMTLTKGDLIPEEVQTLFENSRYIRMDESHWLDKKTRTIYTIENFIDQLSRNYPETKGDLHDKWTPDFVNCYFIREQRLIRKLVIRRTKSGARVLPFGEDVPGIFSETIEEYAVEECAKALSDNIRDILARASRIGQALDGVFPERLFDETESISEKEFYKRYTGIQKKQKSLSLYGFSMTREDRHASFKEENAKALLVYLNHMEDKLAAFNEILQRLDLFSSILNKREFVSKRIEISPDFGFRFITEDDKELPLTELSSGEQQEVVLLYELLFRVGPNTLVLIDEPETSLHVAWQMEFLDDLLKIIELQKITVLVATHSPDIIDKHGDLGIDLWDLATARESRA